MLVCFGYYIKMVFSPRKKVRWFELDSAGTGSFCIRPKNAGESEQK